MNDQSVITLTLGDQAENHAGMQKLGELVEAGQGFDLDDLEDIKINLEAIGIACELVPLELYQDLETIDASLDIPEEAYVLIIRDGVNKILETCSDFTQQDMFQEHLLLELDKQAWMRGRVVNKHARWNVCFDDVAQEPDYEEKKGRIVAYDEIPVTKMLMSQIPSYFGSKSEKLKGEGNYYYDKTKCGIGFHGDSERRKVIGIRLGIGESIPLHYQWFRQSEAIGERIVLNLNGGDMYVMSEKAVGQDWKRKKIHTLRHATGSKKFTSMIATQPKKFTSMIATQQIKSTTDKPVSLDTYESINVLKWNNSKWKNLCPYLLKTDGEEFCHNSGGILFENFYQGCKVYDIVYENEVYPSRFYMNDPKYLWWKFEPLLPSGDVILQNELINYELYYRWRNSLWECKNPIRYPNKIHRRKNTQFALCVDKEGNENRFDYITLRKEIYVKEYIRLIKKLPEYEILLNKLKKGENIMICEIDVPAKNKKGEYGKDCDENNVCHMSIEKLELLLNDTSEAFGHGLCLAYSLLVDLQSAFA